MSMLIRNDHLPAGERFDYWREIASQVRMAPVEVRSDNQAGFLARWSSATIAGPQNRWAGTNRNGYANPAADELLNRVDRTLRREDRMAVWAEANRMLVDDVAFMPLYNYPYPYVVRAGVLGATPGNPINPPTTFVHTWDIQ